MPRRFGKTKSPCDIAGRQTLVQQKITHDIWPNITGNFWADQSGYECQGAFRLNTEIKGQNHTDTGACSSISLDASRSSSIYGSSSTVQVSANQNLIIIKF